MIFKPIFSSQYRTSKKDIVFMDLKHRLCKNNLFVLRHFLNTAKILSKDFNVFIFNISNNVKSSQEIMEMYPEFNYVFVDLKDIKYFKRADTKDYIEKNTEIVKGICKNELYFLRNVKGIFINPNVLFTSGIDNECCDTVKNDGPEYEEAKKYYDIYVDKIEKKTMFNYSAFMCKYTRFLLDTIEYILKDFKCQCYQFIIDPSAFNPYLDEKFNAITYYFENDNRGTRNYHEYPIGQLAYLYNYDLPVVKSFKEKDKKFIWGGNVLVQKGDRMQDWLTFLDKFNYSNSVVHVASKSGFNNNSTNQRVSLGLAEHPLYERTVNSIINHPLNNGYISNDEFESKLTDYRYTLIQKCISKHDSLNFRIYYSLIYNMIPLIDINYDIDNLQIPKKFKDKLEVSNHNDIIDKINYFENHIDEAELLLNEMKNYYINDKYKNESFYSEEFKIKYFKKIYLQ